MILFSNHAKERLAEYGLTAKEVFAIISNPSARRVLASGKVDFFGLANDGRSYIVHVDPRKIADGLIVTIVRNYEH